MLGLPSEPQLGLIQRVESYLLVAGASSFVLSMLAAFTSIAAALAGIEVPQDNVNTAVTLAIGAGFVFLALGVSGVLIDTFLTRLKK